MKSSLLLFTKNLNKEKLKIMRVKQVRKKHVIVIRPSFQRVDVLDRAHFCPREPQTKCQKVNNNQQHAMHVFINIKEEKYCNLPKFHSNTSTLKAQAFKSIISVNMKAVECD